MKREAKVQTAKSSNAEHRISGAVRSDGFCSVFATDGTWKELANSCVQQLVPVSPKANLAFLYVTDAMAGNLSYILNQLRYVN